MSLFGKKKTPEQIMREQQRELARTDRSLQRDRQKLEAQEKQIEAQIKKAAEKGDKLQVQALAKQLVSVRKQREKSFAASSKIGGISQTVTDAQTNIRMTQIMGGTAKVMEKTNKQMDPMKVQKTMLEFDRQNQQMEMTGEMMDDTINGVMEDNEEEADDIVNQVLDEIGVELGASMASAPKGKLPAKAEEEGLDDELLKRLAGLTA